MTKIDKFADDVAFDDLVATTEWWSGGEIEALSREAAIETFRDVAAETGADRVESAVESAGMCRAHFEPVNTFVHDDVDGGIDP